MDVTAYIKRIGYDGPTQPTAETLSGLHRAHLYHVPFENLSIHLGEPIELDLPALFDKIVRRKRGGFCYELNGLFAGLLEALGYQVERLSASSANDDGTYALPFDHLVLQVRCAPEADLFWLADVGWGDGFIEPLRLGTDNPQPQGGRVFRIVPDASEYVVIELTSDGRWLKHYRFDRTPYPLDDFLPMCRYHQTSPESMFTRKRLCTICTPAGRTTLSGKTLIDTKDTGGLRGSGIREEHELTGENEVDQVLQSIFGIALD